MLIVGETPYYQCRLWFRSQTHNAPVQFLQPHQSLCGRVELYFIHTHINFVFLNILCLGFTTDKTKFTDSRIKSPIRPRNNKNSFIQKFENRFYRIQCRFIELLRGLQKGVCFVWWFTFVVEELICWEARKNEEQFCGKKWFIADVITSDGRSPNGAGQVLSRRRHRRHLTNWSHRQSPCSRAFYFKRVRKLNLTSLETQVVQLTTRPW